MKTVMKTHLLVLLTVFFLLPELTFAESVQGNWRWRNDDGGETNATWAADENEPVVIKSDDNIRLRVECYDSFPFGENFNFMNIKLAYKIESAEDYTIISESAHENHFIIAESAQFEDGDPTTKQLSNFYSNFFPGQMINSVLLKSLLVPGANSTEFEFAIKPTSNVVNGIYHFALFSNDQPLDSQNSQISLIYDDVTVSFSHVNSQPKLEIFPNPVSDAFMINVGTSPALLKVTDLSGRVLLSRIVAGNELVDISGFRKGIYLVVVNNNSLKIIKE